MADPVGFAPTLNGLEPFVLLLHQGPIGSLPRIRTQNDEINSLAPVPMGP